LGKYLISSSSWRQIIRLQVFLDEKNISLWEYLRVIISNWLNIKLVMNFDMETPLSSVVLSIKTFKFYQQFKEFEIKKLKQFQKKGVKEVDELLLWSSSIYGIDVSNLLNIHNKHKDLKFQEIIMIFQGEFSKNFRDYCLNGTTKNPKEDSKIQNFLKKKNIDIKTCQLYELNEEGDS
jgi:hypothetical protein